MIMQSFRHGISHFTVLILAALITGCTSVEEKAASTYETIPPEISEYMSEPAILVFSKTREWRHNEGIAGADHYFVELARQKNYGIFTTENSAVFNARDLARFQLIVFNNMTGDSLSPQQESVFKTWLMQGGAWIGIHGSGDNSHTDWPWYQETLIGPLFIGHPADPQFQKAKLVTLAPDHPVLRDIPQDWSHTDEWYSFDSRAQDHGWTPLIGLDERSYSPENFAYGDISDLRMGDGAINHPIVWSGCPGKGRMVYSAIGHNETSYKDPVYRKLLENSFNWVIRQSDETGNHCHNQRNPTE